MGTTFSKIATISIGISSCVMAEYPIEHSGKYYDEDGNLRRIRITASEYRFGEEPLDYQLALKGVRNIYDYVRKIELRRQALSNQGDAQISQSTALPLKAASMVEIKVPIGDSTTMWIPKHAELTLRNLLPTATHIDNEYFKKLWDAFKKLFREKWDPSTYPEYEDYNKFSVNIHNGKITEIYHTKDSENKWGAMALKIYVESEVRPNYYYSYEVRFVDEERSVIISKSGQVVQAQDVNFIQIPAHIAKGVRRISKKVKKTNDRSDASKTEDESAAPKKTEDGNDASQASQSEPQAVQSDGNGPLTAANPVELRLEQYYGTEAERYRGAIEKIEIKIPTATQIDDGYLEELFKAIKSSFTSTFPQKFYPNKSYYFQISIINGQIRQISSRTNVFDEMKFYIYDEKREESVKYSYSVKFIGAGGKAMVENMYGVDVKANEISFK